MALCLFLYSVFFCILSFSVFCFYLRTHSALYGLHFLHGSYPAAIIASLLSDEAFLLLFFICFTDEQEGRWNFFVLVLSICKIRFIVVNNDIWLTRISRYCCQVKCRCSSQDTVCNMRLCRHNSRCFLLWYLSTSSYPQ